jgi:hypothetical protein
MSNDLDRRLRLCKGTVVVSLVAAVTSVFASDAFASRLTAEPRAGEQEISARVAAIAERIRLVDPALLPQLPPGPKMAWRN